MPPKKMASSILDRINAYQKQPEFSSPGKAPGGPQRQAVARPVSKGKGVKSGILGRMAALQQAGAYRAGVLRAHTHIRVCTC